VKQEAAIQFPLKSIEHNETVVNAGVHLDGHWFANRRADAHQDVTQPNADASLDSIRREALLGLLEPAVSPRDIGYANPTWTLASKPTWIIDRAGACPAPDTR